MTGFSELDGLIVLILLAGLAGGALMGTVRQIMALLIFYVGAIVATEYYHPFGEWLLNLEPVITETVRGTIAFLIILLLVNLALNAAGYFVIRDTQIRALGFTDRIIGALLGLFFASLWVITLAVVMEYWLSAPWTLAREPVRMSIIDGFESSTLVTLFRGWDALIKGAVGPFIPDFVPNLFRLR